MTFRSFLFVSFSLALLCTTACSSKSGDSKDEIPEGVYEMDMSDDADSDSADDSKSPETPPVANQDGKAQAGAKGESKSEPPKSKERAPNPEGDLMAPDPDDFDEKSKQGQS